jgi:hypothetical protein
LERLRWSPAAGLKASRLMGAKLTGAELNAACLPNHRPILLLRTFDLAKDDIEVLTPV